MTHRLKILFLGDSNSGKTSIIRRWTGQSIVVQPTFAIEVTSHVIHYRDKIIKIRLSDTSGQDSYRNLLDGYIKDTTIIVLVYDTTNRKSWEGSQWWMNRISECDTSKVVFLIGNKIDRESKRLVYKKEVDHYLSISPLNRIYTGECSAMSGENIKEMYHMLLTSLETVELIDVWTKPVQSENQNGCKIV